MILAGCGAFGALLSYHLCWHNLVTEIDIYDFDMLSQDDVVTLPFYSDYSIEQYKCIALAELLERLFSGVKVNAHTRKFNTSLKTERLVFDCRDTKVNDYPYTCRFSCDCNMMIADAQDQNDAVNDYESSRYLSTKNYIVLNISALCACEYIRQKRYQHKKLEITSLNRMKLFNRR